MTTTKITPKNATPATPTLDDAPDGLVERLSGEAFDEWEDDIAHHFCNAILDGDDRAPEHKAIHVVEELTQHLDDARTAAAEAVAKLEHMRRRGELGANTSALLKLLHADGEAITRAWLAACAIYDVLADGDDELCGAPRPRFDPALDTVKRSEARARYEARVVEIKAKLRERGLAGADAE